MTIRPYVFDKMKNKALIFGDVIALTIITIIGFATHGETGLSFLPRMLTTLIPLLISWFLLAPWFGLFDSQITFQARSLWRAPLAMLLAAPLTTTLRAILLSESSIPIFTLVLGITSALGLLIWRALWVWIRRSKAAPTSSRRETRSES
ncbi:MAG TPA: DUF3054 domain-containing protein [Anaerolineales bacterium]|nr:DUF3054 domain-containing protein [Anaerolineales bacterium]